MMNDGQAGWLATRTSSLRGRTHPHRNSQLNVGPNCSCIFWEMDAQLAAACDVAAAEEAAQQEQPNRYKDTDPRPYRQQICPTACSSEVVGSPKLAFTGGGEGGTSSKGPRLHRKRAGGCSVRNHVWSP